MADLVSLRDAMDRMYDESFFRPLVSFCLWADGSLAVDVYENDDSVVVKTAIPGVKGEDINVSIAGDTLSVKAESKAEEEVKRENYLRRERCYGAYRRSVTLPSGLKTDRAEADFADGILTLTFPKAEEIKPKTIKIKSNACMGRDGRRTGWLTCPSLPATYQGVAGG
jgi:HSP20 family protein